MRLVVGSVLVMRSGLRMWSDPPPTDVTIPAVLLLVAGIMMIAGLWTPIAGTSIALIETWKMLALTGDKSVWLLLGTASAALAMLGPGLWSIDARLFGWKRVEAPPRKDSVRSQSMTARHKISFLQSGFQTCLSRVFDLPRVGVAANGGSIDNANYDVRL